MSSAAARSRSQSSSSSNSSRGSQHSLRQSAADLQQQRARAVQTRRGSWHYAQHPDLQRSTADFSGFADDDEIVLAAVPSAPAAAQPEPDVSGRGPLSLSTRIEYAALPRGRAQDVFGIVTLQAEAAAAPAQAEAEQRQPLDVICVLDVSGSMTGEKLRLVQDAMRFVIRESQPQDRVSIVTFNSQAERPLRLCRMDNRGKDEATAATLRLTAGGGTCIANGVEAALEVAERRRHRNPVSAILLLTDGQDGSSRHRIGPLVTRAQRAGCSLYAFGFGVDHDAQLLSDVAERAQTPFTFVEDVDQIGAAFAGAIGGLSSVAAQRVEVILNAHATLKAVHTPFSVSHEGTRTVVQIPDMLAGERRDLLVELSVAAEVGVADETVLLEASGKYWDLAAGAAVQTPSVEMRLLRQADDEPQPELEPDEEVTTQRNRVEVAQTLQTAAAHGDAGRFEEAQAALSAQEQRLRSGKRMTPISEGLVLELEDARNRMKSESTWLHGGSAELRDAMQMHRMQRSTNASSSRACTTKKCSKAMYLTSQQRSWVSKLG